MTEDKQKELLQDCKRLFGSTSMFEEQSLSRLVTYLSPLIQDFKSSRRVDFTDDIIPFSYTEVFQNGDERIRTVDGMVSLVKYLRDAISHPELSLDFNETNSITIRFCAGKGKGIFLNTPEGNLESQYDDDIAYFHGKATIYHNRHLLRVINAVEDELYQRES
jgi:hypothetical protein